MWSLGFLGLQQLYVRNAEIFYQRFLFTPLAPVYFFVIPAATVYFYWTRQSQIYREMYEKYVGKLSDEELLELDSKGNSNKQIVY